MIKMGTYLPMCTPIQISHARILSPAKFSKPMSASRLDSRQTTTAFCSKLNIKGNETNETKLDFMSYYIILYYIIS